MRSGTILKPPQNGGRSDRLARELPFELRVARLEDVARVEILALVGRPRADLTVARAAGEVGIRFRRIDDLDRPLDPNLFLQRRPVLAERRARILRQLTGLAAAVIRIEHEAPGVDVPEQHDRGRTAGRTRPPSPARPGPYRFPAAGRARRHGDTVRWGRCRRPAGPLFESSHITDGHGRCTIVIGL